MRNFFFLSLLFYICGAPPVKSRSNQEEGSCTPVASPPPRKKLRQTTFGDNDTPICFFKTMRKTDYETVERPEKSKISEICGGNLKSMEELTVNENNLFGAQSILDLILFRGAGIVVDWSDTTSDNWKKKHICDVHFKELYSQWNIQYKRKHMVMSAHGTTESCSVPDLFEETFHTENKKKSRSLQMADAIAVLEKKGVLLHPGLPICTKHYEYFRKLTSPLMSNQCEQDDGISDDAQKEMDCSEEDGKSILEKYQPQLSEDIVTAFREFASSLGIQNIRCNKPLREVSLRTLQRKTLAAREMVQTLFKIIGPDWPEYFEGKLLTGRRIADEFGCMESPNCKKLMESVRDNYYAAPNRANRIIVLSLVVEALPSRELRKFIPELSGYMIARAKKFARSVPKQEIAVIREKFDKIKVMSFVEFLTSPVIMIGLPYGVKTVFNTLGEPIDVPGSVRMFHNARIIELYEIYLKDRQQTELAMSKSSYYKILDACVATKRHSMTCVDYYYADASEAITEMNELFENWERRGDLATKDREVMKYNLEKYFLYLKTDYRAHVNLTDPVMDHCQKHALSDPAILNLQTRITHDHNQKCTRCEQGKILINMVNDTYEDLLDSTREKLFLSPNDQVIKDKITLLEAEKETIEKLKKALEEYKKHVLKASFTDNERSGLIRHIDIHSTAFITMDFAQKWLPMEYMEKQSSYFGKRGVSYHISHVISNLEGETVTHSFAHILTNDAQDSVVVTAIIKHILEELKKVGIDTVFLRSDNAATYKASGVMSSLLDISEKTGVTISRYSFSEVQNGKSDCDRVASYLKNKARRYVNAGGKARDANEFYAALTDKPLKATSIYLGTVVDQSKSPTVIEGITGYNSFVPEDPNGIRAFRYWSVGQGEFFAKKDLTPNKGTFKVEKRGGYLPDNYDLEKAQDQIQLQQEVDFWLTKRCLENSCTLDSQDEPEEDVDNENEEPDTGKQLFECPQEGCSSSFLTEKNLRNHLIKGQHKFALDKTTMVDYAVKSFASLLHGFSDSKSTLSFVKEATQECSSSSNPAFTAVDLKEGWALPAKKASKRFSQEVRQYMEEVFKQGVDSKQRKDPKVVEKEMRTLLNPDGTKRFAPEDYLNAKQIMSYFGRLKSCQKQKTKRSTEDACDGEVEEYAFAKDAGTVNIDDVFLQAVYERRKEIFDDGADNTPFIL